MARGDHTSDNSAKLGELAEKFLNIKRKAIKCGVTKKQLRELTRSGVGDSGSDSGSESDSDSGTNTDQSSTHRRHCYSPGSGLTRPPPPPPTTTTKAKTTAWCGRCRWVFLLVVLAVFLGGGSFVGSVDELFRRVRASKCFVANNFLVMEVSRPLMDCDVCRNVNSVLVLDSKAVGRDEFARYAYSGRPIKVTGEADGWTAIQVFNFQFFKRLYSQTKGALETVEDECQFFPFKTEFLTLAQVFDMSEERANLVPGQLPWYIGWSNCNPDIAAELRKHYKRPRFLPENSESSAIDWIFMGGSGPGASLHLDYVHRPSWQAQISGTKTWHLVPPPECEDVCVPFDVTVNKGDIVLIDTNQWFHNTYIHEGEVSITIGSEYD